MIENTDRDILAPVIVTGHEDKFHYEIGSYRCAIMGSVEFDKSVFGGEFVNEY